jgi:hypothetical protein
MNANCHDSPAIRSSTAESAAKTGIPPPSCPADPALQDGQRAGAGGTTITVSPPVLPVSPVAPVPPVDPVDPVAPVAPVDPVNPVDPADPVNPPAPVAPVGPAGPGTGTVTTVGVTTVGFSHALVASATSTAAKMIEYFI